MPVSYAIVRHGVNASAAALFSVQEHIIREKVMTTNRLQVSLARGLDLKNPIIPASGCLFRPRVCQIL